MKKSIRKLRLTRETIHHLDDNSANAKGAFGSVAQCFSNCPGECVFTAACTGLETYFCATESDGCNPATGSRILCFPTHTCNC